MFNRGLGWEGLGFRGRVQDYSLKDHGYFQVIVGKVVVQLYQGTPLTLN